MSRLSVIVGRSRIATKYSIVAASQRWRRRQGTGSSSAGATRLMRRLRPTPSWAWSRPQSNGIGGDLFAIVYAERRRAPWAQLLRSSAGRTDAGGAEVRGHVQMPQGGVHAVTVPGAIAGWEALRTKLGSLPLADLLAPAIVHANDGFPVSDVTAAHWAKALPTNSTRSRTPRPPTTCPWPRAAGPAKSSGTPTLTASLGRIATSGAAGFMRADREAILAISKDKGGTMSAGDLRTKPVVGRPISDNRHRGWTGLTAPAEYAGHRGAGGAQRWWSTSASPSTASTAPRAARESAIRRSSRATQHYAALRQRRGFIARRSIRMPRQSAPRARARTDRTRSATPGRAAGRRSSMAHQARQAHGYCLSSPSVIDRSGRIVLPIQSIYRRVQAGHRLRPAPAALHATGGALFTPRTDTRIRLPLASGRCAYDHTMGSCTRRASASSLASWAASTRRRRTRSSLARHRQPRMDHSAASARRGRFTKRTFASRRGHPRHRCRSRRGTG